MVMPKSVYLLAVLLRLLSLVYWAHPYCATASKCAAVSCGFVTSSIRGGQPTGLVVWTCACGVPEQPGMIEPCGVGVGRWRPAFLQRDVGRDGGWPAHGTMVVVGVPQRGWEPTGSRGCCCSCCQGFEVAQPSDCCVSKCGAAER
jgi:hypothetical protein